MFLEKSFWVTLIPEYDQSKHPRVHSIKLCRYGKWIYMYILWSKGPVIIYRRGRGGGILGGGGGHLILEEQKGGSVVTENPKGGIAENFGRIQTVGHSNLLGKWGHVGRRDRESHQKLLWGITSVK